MSKSKLLRATVALSGLVVIFVAVGLSIGPTERNMNVTPTPMPTVALVVPSGATLSVGVSASDSTGTVMVYTPAGCFIMGKDDPSDDTYNGGIPFKVCFSQGYWVDKTDVTNAAYQKFINVGGYEQHGTWWSDAGWSWLHSMNDQRPYDYAGFTDPQQPRVGVMWYEANAYCRWRGARLPTEPEWEYGARGPSSLIYPWGNTFDQSKVVYAANSNDKPAPVGSKPDGASWIGALDMSGNVLQWTSTAYEEYDPVKKTLNAFRYPYPATNDGRESQVVDNLTMVVRGNFWNESNISHLNSAIRFVSIPDQEYYRQISIGFRCVRSS